MDALTLTHALEHARRSLSLAEMRLREDHELEDDAPTAEQDAEHRVRAEVALVASLLERPMTSDLATILESAAAELDRELAALDEAIPSRV